MQRSYVAKTTVNFPDFELYVRLGDILVYDSAHGNSLTVYRNGAIVKTIKTSPLSVAAMCKTKMLEEISTKPAPKATPAAKPAPPAPKKPVEAPKPKPQPKVESKKKVVEKDERQKIAEALNVPLDQVHELPPAPPAPTEE